MIKHLIWDLDGTLIDTYPAFVSAFASTLADFGHYPDPDYVLGLTLVNLNFCVETLADAYQITPASIEQGFDRYYSQISYRQQPLMPGAYALCRYIASTEGKNLIVTHRRRSSTTSLLEAHSIQSLITDLIAGDDGLPKKPDPTSFEIIMARNNVVEGETLSIGDRTLDIAAGKAAGIRTCLLGKVENQDQPDFRVDELNELLKIIQQDHGNGSNR
jgi:phosphoglycolate phosphatase-like HAD superfamily hydrolase